MIVINSHTILVLLIVFAVAYAVWTMIYLNRLGKTVKKQGDAKGPNTQKRKKGDIIGKSRFVLPLSGQSQTEAAVTPETELDTEKENIFAPASVPEHPRQIAPEELDDVFGIVPEGETNEPLDIDYPLQVKPFPEEEAEETEDEDESEDLPIKSKPVAQGVSFEQMGEGLQKAEELLKDTSKSVTDIYVEAGFKNFSHFSTAFKKQYGVVPSSYITA